MAVEWIISSEVAAGGTDHLLIASGLGELGHAHRLVGFADPSRAGRRVAHERAIALWAMICEPDLHRHAK